MIFLGYLHTDAPGHDLFVAYGGSESPVLALPYSLGTASTIDWYLPVLGGGDLFVYLWST